MTISRTMLGLVLALASILTSGCTNDFPGEKGLPTAPVVIERKGSVPTSLAQAPVRAFFRYDCVVQTCNFTDESRVRFGGLIVAWAWDFGDGQVSVEQNPSHTYTGMESKFIVTLTVTNDSGSDVRSRHVRLASQAR